MVALLSPAACRKVCKDATIKEQRRARHKAVDQSEHETAQQKQERQAQSKTAFDTWKSLKDDKIRSQQALYTYHRPSSVQQSRGWCPARSIKYDYPHEKVTKAARPSGSREGKTNSWLSASTASFESDESSLESSSCAASEQPPKGVHRTIQVCCQTLEYWCTCDDHQL